MDCFPKEPHCAIIIGQTSCGKTVFILDLLETFYYNFFDRIVIFCTTLKHNKTYRERKWVWTDDNIILVDPSNRLNETLEYYYNLCEGTQTLFIIDDCSAEQEMVKKRKTLSKLAFSGRHAGVTVWLLTQKYNSVLKDFREQAKLIVLFHCKDKRSFESCLEENDVIESKEEKERIKALLKHKKYRKLILKTDVPTNYACL